jgi:hypothetical protein
MTFLSPVYSKKVLLLQLLIIVFFSLALYFFLYSIQEEKRIRQELSTVKSQRQKLQQTRTNVETYNYEVEKNSSLQSLTADPSWEQVEFKWNSISFLELLGRIDSLSYQQKVFVMESFEAGLENSKDNPTDNSPLASGDTTLLETKERFYRLRGYFLCPCL